MLSTVGNFHLESHIPDLRKKAISAPLLRYFIDAHQSDGHTGISGEIKATVQEHLRAPKSGISNTYVEALAKM